MNNKIEQLNIECKTIENNARYTATAHHIVANSSKRLSFWLESAPAVVASASGLLVVGGVVPVWWGWLTVVSSVITATTSIIGPQKNYYENLNAAKSFTIIKHKARSLRESFSSFLSEVEYVKEVKNLNESYNQLILLTPPTQEKAYKRASEKIKAESDS